MAGWECRISESPRFGESGAEENPVVTVVLILPPHRQGSEGLRVGEALLKTRPGSKTGERERCGVTALSAPRPVIPAPD